MLLDTFIKGEQIDLCIPTKEFANTSSWYSWFNDPKITRFLDQGVFPNTPFLQLKFFEEEFNKRLLLVISNKKTYIGIISLSNIDLIKKSAELAIVVNNSLDPRRSPMLALEAVARITEHGFKIMGLKRISAGQHYKLEGWQQRMELLGYRVEGIKTNSFIKGDEVADSINIAVTYNDYLVLLKKRITYWDSHEKMFQRIKNLPSEKFVYKLRELFDLEGVKYYLKVFDL